MPEAPCVTRLGNRCGRPYPLNTSSVGRDCPSERSCCRPLSGSLWVLTVHSASGWLKVRNCSAVLQTMTAKSIVLGQRLPTSSGEALRIRCLIDSKHEWPVSLASSQLKLDTGHMVSIFPCSAGWVYFPLFCGLCSVFLTLPRLRLTVRTYL